MSTPFAGHAATSTAKAIYDDPTSVAPADRLYAADGADTDTKPDVYDETQYASQPGVAARERGYPRAG